MDYISGFVVLCTEVLEDDFDHLIGKVAKDINFLEKEADEVFLVWLSFGFLADQRNRHKFFFIVFVHEISETLLFGEPFRKLATVPGLSEIHSFGILVPVNFSDVPVFDWERMKFSVFIQMPSLNFIVDDGQEV